MLHALHSFRWSLAFADFPSANPPACPFSLFARHFPRPSFMCFKWFLVPRERRRREQIRLFHSFPPPRLCLSAPLRELPWVSRRGGRTPLVPPLQLAPPMSRFVRVAWGWGEPSLASRGKKVWANRKARLGRDALPHQTLSVGKAARFPCSVHSIESSSPNPSSAAP